MNISIKTFLSIITSKIIIKLSKVLFKGGTNFPGRVALKLDKAVLKTVANNYKVVLITGTNGKTTTTSMIYNVLKDNGEYVITNGTGANMFPGIVSCFIDNYKFTKSINNKYAIIEVDEANVKFITEYIIPDLIVITNLFRDQLDRYGEVYTTLNKILQGIEKVPLSTLVLNGDESLLGELSLQNRTIYYGFNCTIEEGKKIDLNADAKFCKNCKKPYSYNFLTYNHLGDFFCENCGYKRPTLDYTIDKLIEITPEGSTVLINEEEYYINQAGIYNIYNALCAYSVAKTLGIENTVILDSLKNQKSSFGRQETLEIERKEIKIMLVKNPAGCDQAINTITLDNRNLSIVTILNDNYADGRDVSWIWDVDFEKLSSLNIEKVLVSGARLYDMGVRLKIADIPDHKFVLCDEYSAILDSIKNCQCDIVYVLATYTAMINFRKFLHSKGYIKNLW